jgi:hypothetical protein
MLFIIAALVVILAMVLSLKSVRPHDDASRTEYKMLAKEQLIPPMDLVREQPRAGGGAAGPEVQPVRRIRTVAPMPPQDFGAMEPSDEAVLFALKSACRMNVMMINKSVDLWYLQFSDWPQDNLADIARDREFFPNGVPRCPVDGSRYRLDPKSHRIAGHSHPEIKDMISTYAMPR